MIDEKLNLSSPLLNADYEIEQGLYHMRPMQESDRPHVLDLFDHLSSKSRYFRYCQHLKNLPESLLERIICPHTRDDVAIGAFLVNEQHEDQTLIGIARYVQEGANTEAEFSLSVRDDFQHEGIGSHLMKAMLDTARRSGYKEVHGYVLSNNHEMLVLMSHLGAICARDKNDATTTITTFKL